jgi:hypothetical protein
LKVAAEAPARKNAGFCIDESSEASARDQPCRGTIERKDLSLMALCAQCKSRVEDGAVRCASCGAELSLPGAFTQVVGWVFAAVSLIPFSISIVTTGEGNYIPLFIGIACLAAAVILILAGTARSRSVPPRVIADEGLSSGVMLPP